MSAFSKDDEASKEEAAKEADKAKETSRAVRPPKFRGILSPNRRLTGWEIIRNSALGLEPDPEEPAEEQEVKYL